ncbi:MAG: ferritin-like domain-containing protein [Actinomycetota bacterium]
MAVLGAGSVFAAVAAPARAATLPDGDLAYLRLLIGAELLGADFYANAAAAQPYGGAAARDLTVALANERAHYASLAAILTGAGQVAATAGDIDFSYPKGSFATTGAVTKLAVELETLFLATYLGAAGGVQAVSLAQPIAQIAANQAQHLAVFSRLLGRSAFKAAMPAPLAVEAATQALAAYTS